MPLREINEQLLANGYTLKLFDDVYLGDKHPHNWICKCNNLIPDKKFRDIRKNKNIICEKCHYSEVENNYKLTVESNLGYTYIRSYRAVKR